VGAKAWNPTAPLLGDLDYDGNKVGPIWTEDGVDLTEAIFGPMYYGEPGFRGKVDSLYAYQAAGPVRFPGDLSVASRFQGKLCAIRWSDPDTAREQGRIMWFGFPFYYAKQAQAQDVFNHAIDWFHEESPLDLKP
jgi:hypothetical protein